MLPGRFELPFAASETAALSIELRELKHWVKSSKRKSLRVLLILRLLIYLSNCMYIVLLYLHIQDMDYFQNP